MNQNTSATESFRAVKIFGNKLPWIIWGLGALFYGYEYFLSVSPSVMAPELMRDLKITGGALGNLSAFYLYTYTLMQIPVGMLLDNLGARRLLTFAATLCMLGCFLFASAHSVVLASIGRGLIGLGSSFACISCFYLAATWLPVNRFAFLSGITLTIAMLGAVGGEGPLSMLVANVGWRHTLFLLGSVGGLLALLIWSIVRDKPIQKTKLVKADSSDFFKGIRDILTHLHSWILALYGGLMFMPTLAFASLWGVPFLMEAHHCSRPMAATLVSLVFIGWAIGAPLFGWFSDSIGKRRPPLIIGNIGLFISLCAVIYLSGLPLWLVGSLLLTCGFFTSAFLPSFSIMRESNPKKAAATSLGFMNTMNSLGGAAAQPLIGLLLDHEWQGTLHQGARVYSIANYHFALSVLPLGVLIAALTLPFIKETFCKTHPE